VLARIDVEAYGYGNARTAAIATANELATPERPLYVRFDWWVGDEATSDVVHIAPAVPRLAFPAEDARL
jgi:hypothetical protein